MAQCINEMAEKKKRKRVNPTYRWGERVTLELIVKVLESVKDSPDSYQKPTSQRYFEGLARGCHLLKGVSWISMKSKMRVLKTSYLDANEWKRQKAAEELPEEDLEKIFLEYTDIKCPHYKLLHQIFGQERNTDFEEIVFDFERTHPPAAFPALSSGEGSELSFTSDHSLRGSCVDLNQTQKELPETSVRFENNDNNGHRYIKQEKLDKTDKIDNNALTLFMTMQREKLQLKRDQFEWRKKKEQQMLDNNFKIKRMQLDKEERLQKKKDHQELENQFQIKQMELEKDERLEKFEIELKYKNYKESD